jgi:hypothetical protein
MSAPTPHDLDSSAIVATLERLRARIAERFPEAHLAEVCSDLVMTGRATARAVAQMKRPLWGLRGLAMAVAAIGVMLLFLVLGEIDWRQIITRADPTSLAQGLDASVNLVLLAGAAVWFLLTAEVRLKRGQTLKALYRLRSFAHVIDMHQLTKDPTAILASMTPTASSPQRHMSEFELARYLEYCAEMLALTAKLAALYASASEDEQVISGVNDVEDLASNLGRKVWQKIMIISQLDETRAAKRP